ncbi:MAG: NAD(P)/FAD-dependent oxidoreductase [Acidobacteria bacterium]|nr:NAD(P)/FAD-dependent oxidoreductase [Acidobacteriota bacterium]
MSVSSVPFATPQSGSSASSAKVVIVGGGFAGLQAARKLARAPVTITLLDRHNHHVFQPLLYQVATAGLSPGDIASPIRWILSKQQNVRVLLADVAHVALAKRQVYLEDGVGIPYDFLILATGAAHSYFGRDDWQSHAPGLKTLDDALAVRRRVLLAFEQAERQPDPERQRHLLTFVVVGGGPTGVELAGTLIEIARHTLRREYDTIDPESARVVLIEAGSSILGTFPKPLRDSARRALRRLGVEVWENATVTEIEADAVHVGGDRVPAHTILWAAGVAASPLARTLGVPLDRAGRVIVEPDLTVPGFPNVFVAGDLARFTHQTGNPLPGVAQVAKQGGAHAAKSIRRRLKGQDALPFHYRDMGNMATVGRAAAVADLGWLQLTGFVAWLFWLFVHIFFLIGFRNRVSVLLQWASSYLTYQRSVRLITGPSPDSDVTPRNSAGC